MRLVLRILYGAIAAGSLIAISFVANALLEIRAFEWAPLWRLMGAQGVAYFGFLVAGLAVLGIRTARRAAAPRRLSPVSAGWHRIFLLTWILAVVWLADWVFLERPFTTRIHDRLVGDDVRTEAAADAMRRFSADGSLDAFSAIWPGMDRRSISIMLARIADNRPGVFEHVSIGRTITKYASEYDVSPALLLHWCYIDSFYGEAPAGRMPFFAEVNGEMFRDLVQAHLPSWFVENPVRVALIEGPLLDSVAPPKFAVKLRYALQKATYDIAIAPYMNSVMSDLFLVLREYPDEFPELFSGVGSSDPLAVSFAALRDQGLLPPYHQPELHGPRSPAYYDEHRDDLITFSRAAVYRLIEDFDFATKAQALVANYYSQQYRTRLGADRWDGLSERQKTALLAMLRDVYTPNIGKVSYNLYMVPEFNTTPIVFLAGQAASHFEQVSDPSRIWVPDDREKLWGATGLMLRTLGETWKVATGEPLAGYPPTATIADALSVLARNH